MQILALSSLILWVLVLLNLALTFALIRRLNASSYRRENLKIGQIAPGFTAKTLNGDTITFANYVKRNIIFLFISPTCQPCREVLAHLKTLESIASQSGIDFVVVSNADIVETRKFAEELSISSLILAAPHQNNSFLKDYKSLSTPSYCAVNEQGKIQSTGHPGLDGEVLKNLLASWPHSGSRIGERS